ncbi:MAG TPA: YccF domain-containing protein [Frankiaceae bacterium]|nr:YccF domain-containing protein [Frankiaceae bacterium]
MRLIGNILWFLLAGLWLAIGYVVAGIANCLTIIGIPFGVASFRLAGYVIWPFGRTVVARPTSGSLTFLGNVLWFFLGGLWLALGHLIAGLLLCVTIVGIPFGIASFKMAGLALAPLGKDVVPIGTVAYGMAAGPVMRPLG